jgi:hypothetical protein
VERFDRHRNDVRSCTSDRAAARRGRNSMPDRSSRATARRSPGHYSDGGRCLRRPRGRIAPGRQRRPVGDHCGVARRHPRHRKGVIMNPVLVLLFGAAGTYLLRLLFIALVPAHRLPDPGACGLATRRACRLGRADRDRHRSRRRPATEPLANSGIGCQRGTDFRAHQESRALGSASEPAARTKRMPSANAVPHAEPATEMSRRPATVAGDVPHEGAGDPVDIGLQLSGVTSGVLHRDAASDIAGSAHRGGP